MTIETDQMRVTRIVTAGSGFLSQHSKQLLCGLGRSERIVKVTIAWPSGLVQTLSDVPINQRVTIEEGSDTIRAEPLHAASVPPSAPPATATPAVTASSERARSGCISRFRRLISRFATSTARTVRCRRRRSPAAALLLDAVGRAVTRRPRGAV